MHWKDLDKAVSLYNQEADTYQSKPFNPYERWYTEAITNPTPKAIKDLLTRWGRMRMSFNISSIQKSIKSARNTIMSLKTNDFELAPLNEIRNEVISVFQVILDGTKSSVAASKALHALAPKFFVMWDNTIRAAYGCANLSATWSEIYFVFLVRVQRHLQKALESYSKAHKLESILKAASHLRQDLYIKGQKSLTKIVDEFNYMRYTKGRYALWIVHNCTSN